MAVSTGKQSSKSNYIKWGIVFIFMFFFRFLPPIGTITPYGMAVLGILIGAILGWTFDPACMLHTSLMALVALTLSGYPGGVDALLTNLMASSSLMLMCFGMLLAGALVDAGVDNYLIAKVMNNKYAEGKPWVITFILVFAPCILSIFIYNAALILFLLPVYVKIFREAGYQAGDKYVIHVFVGAILGVNCSMFFFPFRSFPLAFGGMVRAYTGGVGWTYAEYMLTVTIFTLLVALLYTVFMWIIRCDASKMATVDLSVFGDPNAKISNHQKAVLYCMYAFILGSIVISFGGLMSNTVGKFLSLVSVYGWMMILLIVMMVVRIDGKRLMDLTAATHKGFAWDMVLLVASATLIGGALTSPESGFGAFLTSIAAPLLSGMGTISVALVLFALTLIATNFCNNMAIFMIGLTLIGSLLAGGLQVHGAILTSGVMVLSMWAFLMPSSSMWGAMLHTTELTTPTAIYKNVILTLIYIMVLICAVFLPLCLLVY